ncbi:hypothetical protein [Mesorhizobium sp. Root552]|uniref:hypothetical protein n=1 Tax=Mesorhizobium sp. Root552 TaxID=1736555 RepID=UPI001FCDAF05|nr:hypothetical protein [Mesorhizobium sp. Root552]
MDDAAVVAGLVNGYSAFLFQDDNPHTWLALQQFHGNCQADDAGAHHAIVECHFAAPLRRLRLRRFAVA